MSGENNITTLLVVVGRSNQHSAKAVDLACVLGRKFSAQILLLFVLPAKELDKGYANYVKKQVGRTRKPKIDRYYKIVQDEVLSDLETKVKAKELTCESLFRIGNRATTILDVAKERKVGMIIVTLHQRHGLGLLRTAGSASRRVIENSPCPVVVVP